MPDTYVRIATPGGPCYGRMKGSAIECLSDAPWADDVRVTGETPADGATMLAPCAPSKVVCLGVNYLDHAKEFKHDLPECPLLFLKPASAVIGPDADIVYPGYWTTHVDYEAELALVIGRTATRVPAARALEHVFGYTCLNDVTARDLQRRDGQWTRGKSFDTFCPIGPAIVRGVEASSLRIRSLLNGEVRQDASTADLLFKLPQIVEFVSQVMTLMPGDVIATGTPSGVGPMKPGDVIEVEIEQIGRLRNRVVALSEQPRAGAQL